MLELTRFFFRTGILLVVAGFCSGYVGGLRLYYYFNGSVVTGTPTTRQFVRWVVIPHVFVAIGVGLVIFGIILIGKGIHFHATHRNRAA